MKILLEAYDKFAKSASEGFILRAVFPWIFVIFLNVVIYETLIPDGRSLIDRFAVLHENLQIYAALAIVTAVAGIAGVSDSIADLFIDRQRLHHWQTTGKTTTNSDTTPEFDVEFLRHLINSRTSGQNDTPATASAIVLPAIDKAKTAAHRSAILVIGFGLSIWVSAIELGRYQESLRISAAVIFSLWILMVGSYFLTLRQIKILAELDRILREPPMPRPARRVKPKETLPLQPGSDR
jgi:hypothetical protein